MKLLRTGIVFGVLACGAAIGSAQTVWVEDPHNPVIERSDVGGWAAVTLEVSSVVFDGGTYHMWITGSAGTDTKIGHATSTDGVVWTMDPANPVLVPGGAGEWDDGSVVGGDVIIAGDEFHMWYTGESDGTERVGYATSPDGSTWTKHVGNPVLDARASGSWDGRCVRPASVVDDGGTLRMWFSGSMEGVDGGRIGYAESTDGITWTTRFEPVLAPVASPGGTLEYGLSSPSVVFDGTTYHMWYCEDNTVAWIGVRYAFSTDGVEWIRHRDNPVLEPSQETVTAAQVLFDGNEWHMWYSHFRFMFPVPPRISYATSDCCPGVAGIDHPLFIPAAAVASGGQGSFFQTDVDLSNAGDEPVEYQLVWLPRAEDNSEPVTSGVFTLGAGMSVRYANVLEEVFELEPDALGALAIVSSSPHLLAMSRTFNLPDDGSAGSYGQSIPAVTSDELIRSGERKRILFATENAEMRTNVGCQNATDGAMPVDLELFDMEGSPLGTERMILLPWGNDQMNRIFEDFAPITGYVEVSTTAPAGVFYCYGSVLDNVTSDPTTIPPM